MFQIKKYVAFSIILCTAVIAGAILFSRAETAVTADADTSSPVVIIDAGHGGEDGGATSAGGVRESRLNLEISLRLNDFLHFLGVQTCMTRTEDVSIYTEGTTIAQKKVSDIRHRVQLTEAVPDGILVSIHQNYFQESQYRGAQIFHASSEGSRELAELLQATVRSQIDPRNHRECKAARDIYLLSHVNCPAVLVECGFLSNPEEEQLLQMPDYQKKLAAALGCCISQFLEASNEV